MQATQGASDTSTAERMQQMAHKQQAEASHAAAEQQRELSLFQVG